MSKPLTLEQLESIFMDAPADEFCTNYVRADRPNDSTLDGHFDLERIAALIGAAHLRAEAKLMHDRHDAAWLVSRAEELEARQ